MPIAIAIPIGSSAIIDPAVTAPVIGNVFTFQADPDGGDFSAIFQPSGVTTITAQLEMSMDNQVTWQIVATGANFFPTNAQLNRVITPIIAGVLYRINYTAATGTIVMRVASN